jgi:hypothetical protein
VELLEIVNHTVVKTSNSLGVSYTIKTTESCVSLAKTLYGYKFDAEFKVTAEALHICPVAR